MPPNQDLLNSVLDNPVRDAAIHFGAYLQLTGELEGGDVNHGLVPLQRMKDRFTNDYQPKYHSRLVLSELLNTLLQFGVAIKNKKKASKANVRIKKHPHPQQVREPGTAPRQRIYVDQTLVLRDEFKRSEVIGPDARCRLCSVSFFNEQSRTEHVESDLHKFRLTYREKRSSFKSEVAGSLFGLVGEGEGVIDGDIITRSGEPRSLTVRVTLDPSVPADQASAQIFKIIDLEEVRADRLEFQEGQPIEVNITAMFNEPGAYIFPLVAKVMPTRLVLLKDLIFRVESELMDLLGPTTPYSHQVKKIERELEGALLPGEELPKAEFNLEKKVKFVEHHVPNIYNKFLRHKMEKYDNISEKEDVLLKKVLKLLCGSLTYKEAVKKIGQTRAPFTQPLCADTYSARFSLLIDFEELQEQEQVRHYDRPEERLTKSGNPAFAKYLLKVPDLSEGRPSVTKGDKVHCRLGGDNSVRYEGIIHEIQEQGMLLGFHHNFKEKYNVIKQSGREPLVDVRFTVNRFPILNMHRALSLISRHKALNMVFPEAPKGTYKPPRKPAELSPWINPLISGNPEQQRAVRNIIDRTSGNCPYLVFGPPGTGKTVTLVETIGQVWTATQTQYTHQLVCAPSNAACNNIAERLIQSLPPTANILRLFSLSTEIITVPDNLKKKSNFNTNTNSIYMPTIDKILKNHIVITTIVTAGRLVTGGASGKFDYLYIDECGQATEPEALIAVAGVLTSARVPCTGQLVLAGDPQQLGPVLSSQLAKDFGLGVSLLERLMKDNALYRRPEGGEYDSNYLTKLVQNFRSHPAILEIPNRLFYDNELKVKGNPDIINKAVGWSALPNKKLPLIFHGVQGIDERESNSPSYFNRQEIDRVIMYIKRLFENGLPNKYQVTQEDIGVITPYRKQVSKFRKAFGLLNWDIRVGSVEEFQGSEKLIIFISTVRSNVTLVEEDYRFRLGFLKNPKRFNVSVTRAQALLIVVGNPKILRHDKHWYQLLRYCKDNRAYVGISFPEENPAEHEQEHIPS